MGSKNRLPVLACRLIGPALLAMAPAAMAQTAIIEGAAGAGSGASFGTGDATTVVLMSPTFIDIDIIVSSNELPKLEYGIAFQAEVQGRVSAGIIPQLRFSTGHPKWRLYGLIGVPIFVAPFTMLGVEAGGGVNWRVAEHFGLYGEVVVDLFLTGSDLQEDGMAVRLDGCLGARVAF
jgi:hypothetical protein